MNDSSDGAPLPAVPPSHIAQNSDVKDEGNLQGLPLGGKCRKCVVSRERLGVLEKGESFAKFLGCLCNLMNRNPSSSLSSPSPPPPPPPSSASFSSSRCLIVQLVDGRIVEGELLGVDTNCNLLLQNIREKIFLPWPSIDSISFDGKEEESEEKKRKEEEEGKERKDIGNKTASRVYIQLVERERHRILILGSQIETIFISSKFFNEALDAAQTQPVDMVCL